MPPERAERPREGETLRELPLARLIDRYNQSYERLQGTSVRQRLQDFLRDNNLEQMGNSEREQKRQEIREVALLAHPEIDPIRQELLRRISAPAGNVQERSTHLLQTLDDVRQFDRIDVIILDALISERLNIQAQETIDVALRDHNAIRAGRDWLASSSADKPPQLQGQLAPQEIFFRQFLYTQMVQHNYAHEIASHVPQLTTSAQLAELMYQRFWEDMQPHLQRNGVQAEDFWPGRTDVERKAALVRVADASQVPDRLRNINLAHSMPIGRLQDFHRRSTQNLEEAQRLAKENGDVVTLLNAQKTNLETRIAELTEQAETYEEEGKEDDARPYRERIQQLMREVEQLNRQIQQAEAQKLYYEEVQESFQQLDETVTTNVRGSMYLRGFFGGIQPEGMEFFTKNADGEDRAGYNPLSWPGHLINGTSWVMDKISGSFPDPESLMYADAGTAARGLLIAAGGTTIVLNVLSAGVGGLFNPLTNTFNHIWNIPPRFIPAMRELGSIPKKLVWENTGALATAAVGWAAVQHEAVGDWISSFGEGSERVSESSIQAQAKETLMAIGLSDERATHIMGFDKAAFQSFLWEPTFSAYGANTPSKQWTQEQWNGLRNWMRVQYSLETADYQRYFQTLGRIQTELTARGIAPPVENTAASPGRFADFLLAYVEDNTDPLNPKPNNPIAMDRLVQLGYLDRATAQGKPPFQPPASLERELIEVGLWWRDNKALSRTITL